MMWVILTAMIPAIGTVTSPDSAGIPGAQPLDWLLLNES